MLPPHRRRTQAKPPGILRAILVRPPIRAPPWDHDAWGRLDERGDATSSDGGLVGWGVGGRGGI